MNPQNYFDHAATAPLDPRVREAMLPWLGEEFGNAHSLHRWGVHAREAVEQARAQIAEALGAEDPCQIVFNSGATEGNNFVLRQVEGGEAAVSPFEHSSVHATARSLGHSVLHNEGYALHSAPGKRVVSVMLVSNETGAVLQVPRLERAKLHRDLTQGLGHISVSLDGLDFATLSVHKCGGPQGVGVLFLKEPHEATTFQRGGGQESGLRSGTLNVSGIVGAAKAIQLAALELQEQAAHVLRLRQVFLDELRQTPDLTTDPECARSPHILSLTHPGVLGETLVLAMDAEGFAISAGAACSSESDKLSPTLMALGYTPEMARGTVRISFGNVNTEQSTAECAKKLSKALVILTKSHTIDRPL